MGKLVGALVVLSVLAMPAAALVSCWAPPMMSSSCPLCPMTTHQSGTTTVQAAPAGTSCCDLSSSKPAPASQLQAPTTTTVLAPPAHSVVFMAVVAPRLMELPGQQSASPPASPQAVLCTFLI